MPSSNPTFVERNFTEAEIAYCRAQPSPASSFAARWVGKEAVFKALGVASKGAAAAMKDIEILNDASGAPQVNLQGDAEAAAAGKGIANPVGTILSAAMLLRYSLGLEKYAQAIESAVRKALDDKASGGEELRTADLGGSAKTKEMMHEVVSQTAFPMDLRRPSRHAYRHEGSEAADAKVRSLEYGV